MMPFAATCMPAVVCRQRRGFVLIMVMVVLTGLALLSLHLASRCRMRLAELSSTVRAAQGRWLAHAALQQGLAALQADANDTDAWSEPWAQLGSTAASGLFAYEIEGLSKDLVPCCSVLDEHAKLNIQQPAGLARVAHLGEWGKRLAPLLVDWTDPDEDRSLDGAESVDYQDAPGYGYAAKNKPLELVEELRFLEAVTPDAWFGEDANGNYALDAREDDGADLAPLDNQDGLLDLGPWSLLTCMGGGKINVNTAPWEVLATLPLFDRERAEALVVYRHSHRETAFRSAEDLRQALSLQDWELDVLRPVVCTASNDFRVVAIVYDAQGAVVARQEALVVRDQGKCRIRFHCGG